MLLALIRHGESTANSRQVLLGRKDVPLTERGRAQALAIAVSVDGLSADAVVASPLQRALDTAAPIAARLGLAVDTEHGLIEMDAGEVDGMTYQEFREKHADFLRRWLSDECPDVPMPGGETLRQVQERGWAAVEGLRRRHPDGTVVAVTHNFVILTLLCRATGTPLNQFRRFKTALAARSLVDVREDGCTLLQLNDTSHLRASGLLDAGWW